MNFVWVFHGNGAKFCSAVFGDIASAELWIKKNAISGLLTQMPLDCSVYDWAINSGHLSLKYDYQKTKAYVQNLANVPGLKHHHYVDGNREC